MIKRLFVAASMAAFAFGAGVLNASAQTTGGWTLNINDGGPVPMPAGGELPFDIRITNNDNLSTPATTITFTIPKTTAFRSVEGFDNCAPTLAVDVELDVDTDLTCDVPAMASGEVVTGQINVRPMQETTFLLAGSMASPGPSETSSVITVVKGADLALSLGLVQSSVKAGSVAGFSATITNNGPYPAGTATVSIPIPTGLSPDITLPLPTGCSIVDATIICEIAGPIAEGGVVRLDFSTQVITGDESTITIAGEIVSTGCWTRIQITIWQILILRLSPALMSA